MEVMDVEPAEPENLPIDEPWCERTELSFISDRLRLNLKILSTLRQGRGRGKFGVVFYTILEDIAECSRSSDPNFDVNDSCLCNKIIPSILETIVTLDEVEFNEVQEALILFTFHKWEERKCIRTLRIVSLIFGLIVKIAPPEVTAEFIQVFTKPEVPVQILLFVLPNIIRNCPKPLPDIELSDSNPLMADFMKFISIAHDCQSGIELSEESTKYLNNFWSKMEHIWSVKDALNLLPICLEMKNILPKMNDNTISHILRIIQLQLKNEVSDAVLRATAILLTEFSCFKFNENSQTQWTSIEELWGQILRICLQRPSSELDKTTRLTCIKCLSSFLINVSVSSQSMLDVLYETLKSIPITSSTQYGNSIEVENIPASPTGAYFVEMLEDILEQIKIESIRFVGSERKRLQNVLKGIVNTAK